MNIIDILKINKLFMINNKKFILKKQTIYSSQKYWEEYWEEIYLLNLS